MNPLAWVITRTGIMKYIVKIEVENGGKGVFIEEWPADAGDVIADALISAKPGVKLKIAIEVTE